MAQQSEKYDRELKAKLDEQAQDRFELEVARNTRQAYVNTSDLLKYWWLFFNILHYNLLT